MIAPRLGGVRKVQAAESRVPSVSSGQAQEQSWVWPVQSHRNYVGSFTLKVEENE